MQKLYTFITLIIAMALSLNMYSQDKEWTLLVYMVGSDIVDDGIADLGEMQAAGSTENINIVALLGGSKREGWNTPAASIYVDGIEIPAEFDAPGEHMAIASNISEFIDWGVTQYPAKRYMMIFYNHGMDIRGFGWDEFADKALTVNDIQTGIANSEFIQNNNKFEILGFDACLMASLEVMAELQSFSKYYVASEETEPYHAWYWTPVIEAMNGTIGITTPELGQIIVDNYMLQSQDLKTENVTLSMVEMDRIPELLNRMNILFTNLNDDIYLESFQRARGMSEEYHKVISTPEYSEDMVDLGDLLTHLKIEEPGISDIIDDALNALRDAVVYERSDATRPKATGISMYVPFNVLANEDEAYYILEETYQPLNFEPSIKNFISSKYFDHAISDNQAVSGSIDDSFGFSSESRDQNKNLTSEMFTGIRIEDYKSLDQVQVVLLEEIVGVPNEFILLGSSYPDTMKINNDGSASYGYLWDEKWLSINEYPAYISDIQEVNIFNDNGELVDQFTRIHIPALLNNGTPEAKEIMMSFVFDENFEHSLESILREPYGENIMIPSKERIDLKPGDKLDLLYEVFDAISNQSEFVVNPQASIIIENGNEDLDLGHAPLEPGKYHLGFVLMDHAHNDTIIYDPRVFEINMTSTRTINENESFRVYPNPAQTQLTIQNESGYSNYSLQLIDAQGRVHSLGKSHKIMNTVNLREYAPGVYLLKIIYDNKVEVHTVIRN